MHAHRAAALGILYAEDFGSNAPPTAAPEPRPSPVTSVPLTQGDVEAACHRAVALARTDWAASLETRRTAALETVAAGLAEAREAADEAAEAVADGVARTVLTLLAGLLPEMGRTHGDAEVRVLLQAMLPVLAAQRNVVVRVHAGLIEALADDLAAFDEDLATRVELRPANLPPGDARLAWEDGSLVRDTAAIHQALTDALSRLGLLDRDLVKPPNGYSPLPNSIDLADLAGNEPDGPNGAFEALPPDANRQPRSLDAVYDIPVTMSAVLGNATMQVSQLLKLGRGAVVELDRKLGEAIDIYVNNRLVARGEVVMVDETRLGVTMTEIVKGDRSG